MYHVLESLVRWIAPVLSFTAEEIHSHIPGKRSESIFLETWYQGLFPLSGGAAERERWQKVIELRETVSKAIEQVRQAGKAGSSLAVEVDLWLDDGLHQDIAWLDDELRFVLLTSDARVHALAVAPADAERVPLGSGEIAIRVTPSEHEKCIRCWHYRADVGVHPEHPEICGRCVENVDGSGEIRRVA